LELNIIFFNNLVGENSPGALGQGFGSGWEESEVREGKVDRNDWQLAV
jgi:hypothetical protein